jgi:sugar-specific transcriptional regulator TrmB
MTPDEQVRKLRKLGLSRYEALVYLALLGEDGANPTKVARKAGVPQPRVYGALSALVERGYAELLLAEGKTYRAVPPTVAFKRYKQRAQSVLEDTLKEMAGEMDELEKLAPIEPSQDPSAFGIRLVRGASQSERAFIATYEAAQSEILLFVRAPLRYPPVLDNDRALSARGVKLKWVVERALVEHPEFGPAYRQFAETCGELRTVDKLPVKLAVFDRKTYLVPLTEADDTPTMLIIPNAHLAQCMADWFFETWDRAKPLEAARRRKTKAA